MILGVSDIIGVVAAIQSIFFGLILLMFVLNETSNAFADVYSAAISTQSIFHKIKQRYLIIGFTVLSIVLAIMVPISQYETFLLLIGAVFVPLFGVVISDYYIVKDRHYETTLMYGSSDLSIGFPAIIAWSFGVLLYYLLSSISPVYIPQWPQIGSTIPSFIGSSVLYFGIMKINL